MAHKMHVQRRRSGGVASRGGLRGSDGSVMVCVLDGGDAEGHEQDCNPHSRLQPPPIPPQRGVFISGFY